MHNSLIDKFDNSGPLGIHPFCTAKQVRELFTSSRFVGTGERLTDSNCSFTVNS